MPSYDAFLLLSFGGPEGPDDVLPFLENVTRGRGVPRERLAEVAEHYYAVGGVSPINAQCREMLEPIAAAFARAGIDLPMYWGNRNWHPFLADTVREMADGVQRAIAFVTSAYSSYSACRQYYDDIDRAVAAVGRRRAAHRQDPPVLQPPGLHRAVRGRRGRRAGHARPRGAGRRQAGLHRAQRPAGDGRRERQPYCGDVVAGRRAAGGGRLREVRPGGRYAARARGSLET